MTVRFSRLTRPGVATVMTRNGKTQTVQGQVIPFASSVNDRATGISARFALRGDKLMEGMYQFEWSLRADDS